MTDDRKNETLTTAAIAGTPERDVRRAESESRPLRPDVREMPDRASAVATAPEPPRPDPAQADRSPLLPGEMLEEMKGRWRDVQSRFVDEPRSAVEQADGLVAEVMKRTAEVFARERTGLEQQWGRNEKVSTEDLRLALQKYRSFFERLLDV